MQSNIILVHPLKADTFAPYGWMLGKPLPQDGERPRFSNPATDFWHEHLFEVGEGGEPEILWVNYRSTDPSVATLETHHLTQQALVPLTGSVLHIVATSAEDGSPDLSTLTAFHISPGQGVCMRPGCWHATRVTDREVTCLMLTRRSTTLDLIEHLNAQGEAQESALVSIEPHTLDWINNDAGTLGMTSEHR